MSDTGSASAQTRSPGTGVHRERRLLHPRRPRRLSGSVVADAGFCFQSATRSSGSPRLSSQPATEQKPTQPGRGQLLGGRIDGSEDGKRRESCRDLPRHGVPLRLASLGRAFRAFRDCRRRRKDARPRPNAGLLPRVCAATRALDQKGTPTMGTRPRDKTALVTDTTINIGRAIGNRLHGRGAQVVVSGCSWQGGTEVFDQIRGRAGAPTSSQRISMAGVVRPPTLPTAMTASRGA